MRLLRLLIVLALVTSSLGNVSAAPAMQAPRLRLHRTTLDAQTAGRITSAPALMAPAADNLTIVQFAGPITPADRAALEATGVTLLEYIPDFAYLVRGSPAQIAQAANLAGVRLHAFTIADKLSPALLRSLARGADPVGSVQVIGWPNDAGTLARELRTLPINVAAPLTASDLLRVASLPSVRWIETASHPRLLNDVARSIMHVDSVWQNRSLFGAGQTVAVLDSGLDVGITPTLSADFAGRIVATHIISPGGDIADQAGHGTHVTGSVAGAGVQSGAITATHQYSGSFAGVAPEASLVIQAFEADNTTGEIFGLGTDYYPHFNQAYADGARIHSNSWGDLTGPITDTAAAYGGYPFGSQRADQFIWDHPDMTIFFAAGNSGKDGTPMPPFGFCDGSDGVVDPDSLLAPGTAKNVVTVGASESSRNSGGLGGVPWFYLDFCFGAFPIATDAVSNDANGMAAFSSRGPADDGRIKPDLVAPGTNIVSNRTHVPGANPLWGQHETNPNYAYSGGTSMSTPLVAGDGVLVRQWLGTRGIANPSAALIKALLLNTTIDMAPGQYGTGPTQEIPFTRPNSVAGWGRADLGFITAPLPYGLWSDDHTTGIATGAVVTYTHSVARPLEVVANSQPLRVMLVWTDPPASLSASAQLVNDLDLDVIGPDGTIYHGNSATTADRVNNVEGVIINNPPLGKYTVRVRGYNVPFATQPYALAVAGPIGGAPAQLALSKTANPIVVAPGGLITYTLSITAQGGTANGVMLTDTLPVSTTFVSASGVYTPAAGAVTWMLGDLSAGQTATRTLTVAVAADVPRSALIQNANYQASGTNAATVNGPPVNVAIQRFSIWLPFVAR